MKPTLTRILLPAICLAVLMVTAPVSASGCVLIRDDLVVPWNVGAPPGEHRDTLEDAEVVITVADPPEGGRFRFSAVIEAEQCVLGTCLEYPQLRAAWYDGNDSLIEITEDHGFGVNGTVPEGAAYGLVFMRFIPYVFSTPVPVPLEISGFVCSST